MEGTKVVLSLLAPCQITEQYMLLFCYSHLHYVYINIKNKLNSVLLR